MAVYELKTYKRAARPRSKRLRGLGVTGAVAGGSTVVSVAGAGGAPGGNLNDHWHDNKVALDQITTDDQGYQYLTRIVEGTDEQGNPTIDRITGKVRAGHADVAHDLTEDSPIREQFLSKLYDDVARGNITFEKMITALGLAIFKGGADFGTFAQSLYAGTGARIDANGNAEFESVRVRSYFECLELIINRLSAIEGDQVLTECDTIEHVDDLGGGLYGLHLKPKWEGYTTAQAVGNVLKGMINTLADGGDYCTSWLRVNSVDPAQNYMEVTAYADTDTPAGKNYPPVELMKIARWGNQTDTTRQSCIYLSSTEGRIVRLSGVTKPIIDASNYGATFGTLPEFLQEMDLPVVAGQDYVYARGLVVQDIIRVDYQGKPVCEAVDRGAWRVGADYYCQDLNPATGRYEISDVWYNGCKYRCAKTGTKAAPAWSVTDWAMIEGDPTFRVEFAERGRVYDPDNFRAQLTVKCTRYNADITDQVSDEDVQWLRYSESADGTERSESDAAWAVRRAGAGKTITLTADDCDYEDGQPPKVLRFMAAVTLRPPGYEYVYDAEGCLLFDSEQKVLFVPKSN